MPPISRVETSEEAAVGLTMSRKTPPFKAGLRLLKRLATLVTELSIRNVPPAKASFQLSMSATLPESRRTKDPLRTRIWAGLNLFAAEPSTVRLTVVPSMMPMVGAVRLGTAVKLIAPPPVKLGELVQVPTPPKLRVAPGAAPQTEPTPLTWAMVPVRVLTPETERTTPPPLMPLPAWLEPSEMLVGTLMLPERCRAPVAFELEFDSVGMEIVPEPRPLAWVSRITPPRMTVLPVQVLLLAETARVPLSSFSRVAPVAPAAERSKAVSSVKVLPGLTSMMLAALALPILI